MRTILLLISGIDYLEHREDVLLENVDFFKNHMVIMERERGLRKIEIRPWNGKESHYIEFNDEAYSVYSSTNAEIDTKNLDIVILL